MADVNEVQERQRLHVFQACPAQDTSHSGKSDNQKKDELITTATQMHRITPRDYSVNRNLIMYNYAESPCSITRTNHRRDSVETETRENERRDKSK